MKSVVVDCVRVLINGRVVEAEVRRSERARTTRIQVGHDVPLRVIVPAGASDEFAAEALRNKATWVLTKLRQLDEARERPRDLGLDRSGRVWMHGASVPVRRDAVPYARLHNGALVVPHEEPARAIERWYRRTARRWLRELVTEEAERLGVDVTGLGVRDQRTRWGSCSRQGHISLNWRLLLVPEPVARYVIVHELVHLVVPNHTKAFWRKLGVAYPDWRVASAWLSHHGDELRGYAPGPNASLDAEAT